MAVSHSNLEALRAAWPSVAVEAPETVPLHVCGIGFDARRIVPGRQLAERLLAAADQAGIAESIKALYAGDAINKSEQRPALHMALRDPQPAYRLNAAQSQAVVDTRERVLSLAESLRTGRMPDGTRITDIVHIGIGGSDLSPRLLSRALQHPGPNVPAVYFLSAPATNWPQLAEHLNPATTLVIAASKSFGTAETLHNLRLVRSWQQQQGATLAVTANADAALAQGFNTDQILPLWPWVGGRYAFSSAVSLVAAVAMGDTAFQQMLAGAHALDRHFRDAALSDNLPLNMALVDFWQHVIGGYPGRGVFTFDPRLGLLSAWLQQLEMESNGKSVDIHGQPLNMSGAPLVFGGDGSDAQHALFQMLHQGQTVWPLELVGVLPAADDAAAQLLYAQLQGQAETFRRGDPDAAAHARLSGGRPVSLTTLDKLDAWHVGALLAAYEHKTFCLAQLIGCNPFDQWGVEAGKRATVAALGRMTLESGD